MIKKRRTRGIRAGKVGIGSSFPVSIQSMTNTDTSDVRATVSQIKTLEKAGCEIVRVSVKNAASAEAIPRIKKKIGIPLVADIHFDHKLAVLSTELGADKIRVNPGNISVKHMDEVIEAVSAKKIPLRLGINSGSLMAMHKGKGKPADIMVKSLLKYAKDFQKKGFHDIVISVKSSDISVTVDAYRKISRECDYPMHLGVTAAGPVDTGIIKSSIGIGALLLDGIGDTIRVSLTGDPVAEVYAAKKILTALGIRKFGHDIISCPTCGRCQVDIIPMVSELGRRLQTADYALQHKNLTIAVMGCEVNGPGEARMADLGIAFGKGRGVIFKKGKIIKTVSAAEAVSELVKIISEVENE